MNKIKIKKKTLKLGSETPKAPGLPPRFLAHSGK
jgi:hypothetical protein